MWPRWLADDIPGLGVWSIEHESAPTLWHGHAMPLGDRVNNILPLLLEEEHLAQGDIAFVAHSFGGLILEQLLRVANDRSASEPQVAEFVRRVSRIAFLGTPHHGANLATWAGTLRLIVRPSSVARGLARNDSTLRELNQWFRRYAAHNGIAIRALVETKTLLGVLIVPPDSADPGLPSDPIPVDANHLSVASPASPQSEVYVHIKNFLKAPSQRRRRQRLVDGDVSEMTDVDTTTNTAALKRIEETLTSALASASPAAVPRELVETEAIRRVTRLRKSRFFNSARRDEQALRLAEDLLNGDLATASATTRAKGLAWCARLLLGKPERTEGLKLVKTAARLADTEEGSIAEALEQSYTGNLEDALGRLSRINSRAARSAAFIAIKTKKSGKEALNWLRESDLRLADIDSDGRLFVIATQLDEDLVEDALASCEALGPSDFRDTPALWYIAANAYLTSVVPRELATLTLLQPPFTIGVIPLADDVRALERRRKARHLYQQAAVAADEYNCREISDNAKDRALLLGLRDPTEKDRALTELEHSMRTPEHSLRRVPIALQCDLKVDLVEVEQEIGRQVALSSNASMDAALARIAIAQRQNPKECAEYIQRHRHELTKHLNPSFLAGIEVHALVRSGQSLSAQERLEELLGREST